MSRRFRAAVVVFLLLVSLTTTVFAAPGDVTDPAVLKDLAAVRQATQKYHDVNQAYADGFIPVSGCEFEEGVGTMGVHFLNVSRAMDSSVNLLEPELLLYLPTDHGYRLIGVEYFVPVGPPDAPVPNPAPPAPVLFGRAFDGPMLGHGPGMPPHYDLHVWVWEANPNGVFTPFNPAVKCP